MQQPVHAAQVHEGAIVHEILDASHQNGALGELCQELALTLIELLLERRLAADHHITSLSV